ncbi:MAG TPA: exodeoxyribonuclease VII large subunit [Nitrospira sp.]|jgi:exodeoxyribonuclease VII large subunit|nr:exodeoxyribonuclease VII large subunit [Nitrospira sp.]
MSATKQQTLFPHARSVLTVSQLTGLLRTSIESQFADLWLEGEVSNLRMPGSGHIYCTLKDEFSQIRAVLFRSTALRLKFTVQEGMCLIVRGRVTVYEPRGEYQIVLDSVEPKGMGALQLAFEQLKARLSAEGLFDEAKKSPLPPFPERVGIVTSSTGAAIRDILSVLHRRWPTLHVIVVPVPVQGEGAAQQIAKAVAWLNEEDLVDVMIVGRGGGSMEDLWSFNEEVVVRAVAGSRIPVISAVGHETDVTLTDFAADRRAPTPSAAAETVVPVLAEVVERLRVLTIRATHTMGRQCVFEQRRLESQIGRLAQVRLRIRQEWQRTQEAVDRLRALTSDRIAASRDLVRHRQRELAGLNPVFVVKRSIAMISFLMQRLERQVMVLADGRRRRISAIAAQLTHLSPLAILGRGYSILSRLRDGVILKKADEVQTDDEILARLSQGQLHCTVKRVLPDPLV